MFISMENYNRTFFIPNKSNLLGCKYQVSETKVYYKQTHAGDIPIVSFLIKEQTSEVGSTSMKKARQMNSRM
jgi:hypothetical protein